MRVGVVASRVRRRLRAPWWWLLLALLPWTWFVLRDPLGLLGDVFAVVLVPAAAVAAAAAVWVGRWRGVPTAVSVVLAATVAVLGPWTPQDAGAVRPGAGVTVAGANITGLPSTLPALRALDADVLVVSEVDPAVDAALATAYPQHLVDEDGPHVGVYSRFPLRLLEPAGPDLAGLRVAVEGPTPFELIALHVPRPWLTNSGYQATPAEHHRLMQAVAARVARATGPVVVAGDLNSTDRARDYRSLVDGVGLTDAMRDGWAGPTQVTSWQWLLVRIDHLLVSPGWCGDASRRFDLPGSDHVGITATVGPCAPG